MNIDRWSLAGTITLAVILAGCSKSDLPIVPVTGKVTYNGGPWPAKGSIVFSPLSVVDGHPRRPGLSRFETDGTFSVTSFKPGDGLIPGTYSVSVTCYEKQPESSNPITFETYNLVPKDFKAEDVVVDPSARSVTVEIDVLKKK